MALAAGAGELLLVKKGAEHASIGLAVMIVAYAVLVWFGPRLIVLFPAIAVQAKATAPGDAFADTKGYSLRLLALIIVTFIPPVVLGLLVTLALGRGIMVRGSVPFVIGDIVSALVGTLIMSLGVVLAFHVYLAIGNRGR